MLKHSLQAVAYLKNFWRHGDLGLNEAPFVANTNGKLPEVCYQSLQGTICTALHYILYRELTSPFKINVLVNCLHTA